MKKSLVTLVILFSYYINVIAQDVERDTRPLLISTNFEESSIIEIISSLATTYNLRFFYKEEWLTDKSLSSFKVNDASLDSSLQTLLRDTGLNFSLFDGDYIILFPQRSFSGDKLEKDAPPITLTGIVTLANLATPLANVSVYADDLKLGTVTNMEGAYSIDLPPGKHIIVYKSLEFLEEQYDFTLSNSNSVLNVALFEKNRELEEVVVTGNELNENLSSIDVGKVQLSKEFFRKLPTFLGEIDINRVLISLPGVQAVGEGTTDFNVRGGNRDQNLILMDGIPIYNTSHLLGFFSVFNPDLISSFTLYKGSIPANYGGRLSSVLTVDLKNPTTNDFELEGGVGFVSNRLSLNIPLAKKHAIRIAGRYSDPTWILRQVEDKNVRQSSARYYDFNLKYRYTPNSKNTVIISSFYSQDNFNFAGTDAGFDYQNIGASAKYVHNFNSILSTQFRLAAMDYSASSIDNFTPSLGKIFKSGINSVVAYGDIDYQFGANLYLNGGFESTLTNYNSGSTTPLNEASAVKENAIPPARSLDNSLFLKSEINISAKIIVGLGLRYSIFSNLGPQTEYVFDQTQAKSEASIIDTLETSGSNIIRSFSGFEPRISATYLLQEDLSLKISYSRTRQYQYLFSNSAASLPIDIWKPADNNIPIQIADQFSFGLVAKLGEEMYDLSADVYYKEIPSTALLKIGVPAIGNTLLVADIVPADGFSYGAEVLLRKIKGKFNGFLAYTYSVAKMRILSNFPSETVNNGSYFFADFDSRHNLSVSANYKVNRLLNFSANFLYNTGRPVTIPTASFTSDNVRVFAITERNNFRIPDTHRLDIAVTLEGSYKKNRRWHSSWIFSIYNVYGRENPFSVYLRAENNTQPRLIKLSVLGNAFPSITYNFKLLAVRQDP